MRSLLRKYTLPGFIICALGLAGLFALYVAWLFDTDYSLWAYSRGDAERRAVRARLPALCARWMRFWGGQDGPWPRCGEAAEPARIRAKLALAGFLYCFGVFLICGAVYFAAGRGSTLRGFLDFWECLDSGHYIDIGPRLVPLRGRPRQARAARLPAGLSAADAPHAPLRAGLGLRGAPDELAVLRRGAERALLALPAGLYA